MMSLQRYSSSFFLILVLASGYGSHGFYSFEYFTYNNRQMKRFEKIRKLSSDDLSRVKRSLLTVMKDQSSANVFKVGDTITVVDDVIKGGRNLRGRIGTVVEVWEKCDVDPTCCCAEFVDRAFAVTVKFIDDKSPMSVKPLAFVHYFSEEELQSVPASHGSQEKQQQPFRSSCLETHVVPFDGLSCKAFKVDQLRKYNHTDSRRIAAFEPASRSD